MAAVLLICMASFVFCTGMKGGLEERLPGLFKRSGPPVVEIDGRSISARDLGDLRQQRNFANIYMKQCADLAYKNVSKRWFDLSKETDPKNADRRKEDLTRLAAIRATLAVRKNRPRYFDIGVKFDDLVEFKLWQAEADRLGIRIESDLLDRIFILEFFGALGESDMHAALFAARQEFRDATDAYIRRAIAEEIRVKIAQYATLEVQAQRFMLAKKQQPFTGKFESPDMPDEIRAPMTLAQLWDFYKEQRAEFTVSLIPIYVEDFAKNRIAGAKKIGDPDDIQKRTFFDERKNEAFDPTSDKWSLEIPPRIKIEYLVADPLSPAYLGVAKFIARMNVDDPKIANPVAYPLMDWPGLTAMVAAQKHMQDLEGYYESMINRNRVNDKYRGAALYTDPDCISPVLGYFASRHPQAAASLIGASAFGALEGAGFLGWGTLKFPLEGAEEARADKEKTKVLTKLVPNTSELAEATFSEAKRRAPLCATVLACGLTGIPLEVAAPFLSLDATVNYRDKGLEIKTAFVPPFYTVETVQQEIETILATRTAEEWAQENIQIVKKALDKTGGDENKFRRELKSYVKQYALTYGPSDAAKEVFHDRFTIAEAPEFQRLKAAYLEYMTVINLYEGRDTPGRRLTPGDFYKMFFDPTESFAIFATYVSRPWPPEVKSSNMRDLMSMHPSLTKDVPEAELNRFNQRQVEQDPNRPAPSLALYKTAPSPILFWKTAETSATRYNDYKELGRLKQIRADYARAEAALAKDPHNAKLKKEAAKLMKEENDLKYIRERIIEGWKFDRARNTEVLPEAKRIASLLIDRANDIRVVKEEADRLNVDKDPKKGVINLSRLSHMHQEQYFGKGFDYGLPPLPQDKFVYPRDKMMEQILSLHDLKKPIETGNKEIDDINKELFDKVEARKNPDQFVQILVNKPRSVYYVAAITVPPTVNKQPFKAAIEAASFLQFQQDRNPNSVLDRFVDRAQQYQAKQFRAEFIKGLGEAHNLRIVDTDARKTFDDRGGD